MQAFTEESKRVLKKQRLCAAQIDAQLDFLLEEAAITKRQLLDKQEEFRRKKSRHGDAAQSAVSTSAPAAAHARSPEPADENADKSNSSSTSSSTGADRQDDRSKDDCVHSCSNQDDANEEEQQQQQQASNTNDDDEANTAAADEEEGSSSTRSASPRGNQLEGVSSSVLSSSSAGAKSRVFAEEEDSEVDNILQGFIHRVRLLNVEKNVADELKAIHVALSKYSKQIDKTFCNDITKVCRSQQFDHKLVCRLVAEYLYQDGQIDAADAVCQEAELELASSYRACFVELHHILKALKTNDMDPALEWARKYRVELRKQNIEIEFELVRLQYVDLLASCAEAVDALAFATEQFSVFHDTHAKEIHRLMGCLVFKDRLSESPYKDLFTETRWDDIRTSIIRACCKLRSVPFKSYLETCLSAGVSALPAMRKLVTVMESKLTSWESLEELPVEIPISNDLRFHTVFCCPVSKEESAPGNPPVLLKCGHAICKACVKRISFNLTRRFKCPTCPAEMTESETREIFF